MLSSVIARHTGYMANGPTKFITGAVGFIGSSAQSTDIGAGRVEGKVEHTTSYIAARFSFSSMSCSHWSPRCSPGVRKSIAPSRMRPKAAKRSDSEIPR